MIVKKKRVVSAASLANLRPAWKKGDPSPNPAGCSSKSILYQRVLMAVSADFEIHGAEAFNRLREDNLPKWFDVVMALLPKEVEIDHFSGSSHRSATKSELAEFFRKSIGRSEETVIEGVSAEQIKNDMP